MKKKPVDIIRLSEDQHAQCVLDFFVENRDFFEKIENTEPNIELVQSVFRVMPAGIPPERKVLIGCVAADRLIVFVELIKDRYCPGEWLLSLLLLDKSLRKSVQGGRILLKVLDYIQSAGAISVVDGVVEGNESARKFWLSIGATSTDTVYEQVLNGKAVPTRVMYKVL